MFFTVTQDDVSPALSATAARAKNPLPIFRAMGTTFKSITEGTFNSVGASYRPAAWKAKADGSPSILQSRNPTLSKSFALEVSNAHARVSNPMPYAAIHQFGGVIKPKKGDYFRINIPGIGWRTLKQIVMPARPFFPVVDGKLTPKAEEKIARAGERAMQRQILKS